MESVAVEEGIRMKWSQLVPERGLERNATEREQRPPPQSRRESREERERLDSKEKGLKYVYIYHLSLLP